MHNTLLVGYSVMEPSLELFVDTFHLFVSSLLVALYADSLGSNNTKRVNFIMFDIFFLKYLRTTERAG